MAPRLVAAYGVNSPSAATTALVTPQFTPANGEVIVVKAMTEDFVLVPGAASGGSQTFTSRNTVGSATNCAGAIHTAIVSGSPVDMTVSQAFTGTAKFRSMFVERWAKATLGGTPAVNATKQGTSTAPNAILSSAVGVDAVISWVNGDWTAASPSGRVYREFGYEEWIHDLNGVNYVAYYVAQYPVTASPAIGMLSPTQKWNMIGVEILGDGSSETADEEAKNSSAMNDMRPA